MKRLKPPLAPMEALSVAAIPRAGDWQYEPKWDGFRCLVFRQAKQVELQSKGEKPLTRYFPEIAAAMAELAAPRFVLDGELVVPVGGRFDFNQLLQRIHPAESRVRKLAAEHPALFVAFDLLADERGVSLLDRPLAERRALLEQFAQSYFAPWCRFSTGKGACRLETGTTKGASLVRLSPATTSLAQANRWFRKVGGNLDGVIAKQRASPYLPGERGAMVKVKRVRTADCVVGGFRYASHGRLIGSLLLGLYDDEGLLHHVGFTANIKEEERAALTHKLEKLVRPPGFTGQAPGGPSRWSTKRSSEWQPLATKLVVEVAFDHFTNGRFRHGTSLLRWRPDKSPRQCTFEQVSRPRGADVRLLELAPQNKEKESPR